MIKILLLLIIIIIILILISLTNVTVIVICGAARQDGHGLDEDAQRPTVSTADVSIDMCSNANM